MFINSGFFNPFSKRRALLLVLGLLFSIAASAQQFVPADHPDKAEHQMIAKELILPSVNKNYYFRQI